MWAIEEHSSYSDYFELFMKRVLGIHHFFSVGMCGLRGRDEESFQMWQSFESNRIQTKNMVISSSNRKKLNFLFPFDWQLAKELPTFLLVKWAGNWFIRQVSIGITWWLKDTKVDITTPKEEDQE